MKLGTKNVTGLKLGTVNISRAYLGSTLVWEADGGTPPTGYRYHRLRFLGNNGRSTLNIADVQLRESAGGANVATGGTPTASSVFETTIPSSFPASNAFDSDVNTYWSTLPISALNASSNFSGFPASNAVDGDPSTFWATATGVTAAQLTYDAGASVIGPDITKYQITARADAADGAPKDWTLEYSDNGGTWTVADTVTGETGWANGETREFTLASVGAHRAWRLNISANNGRSTINIAEIAFDGYSWGSITLQYDQGSGNAIAVAEYTIQARADANDGSPKDWTFEGSNDLETWDTLDTVTGETGWSNGETRVFTL